jgi:hypothetical protein
MPKIKGRLEKECAVCGRKVRVILYNDRSYRGGHYFGKIPFYKKGAINFKDTKKVKVGGLGMNVLQNLPKPYKYEEYWECPKCYWGK